MLRGAVGRGGKWGAVAAARWRRQRQVPTTILLCGAASDREAAGGKFTTTGRASGEVYSICSFGGALCALRDDGRGGVGRAQQKVVRHSLARRTAGAGATTQQHRSVPAISRDRRQVRLCSSGMIERSDETNNPTIT